MYISGDYLLLIAVLLFLTDIGLILYALIFRRYAIVPMSGISRAAAVFAVCALSFACVKIVQSKSEILADPNGPLGVFEWSLYTTLCLLWMVIIISRSDRSTRQLLETLVAVTEASAPNLNGNALYVQLLSSQLYRHLPIDLKLRVNPNELYYAALLIDVGQLGIPRELREKWGKLSDEERIMVRKSPDIASRLLRHSKSFRRISEWIRYIGEHMDGSGRLGMKGEDIPLASRILAIPTTYAAITLSRTYKASRTCTEAMEELKLVSGTQLDAELVDIFTAIPIEEIEECLEKVKKRTTDMRNIGICETGQEYEKKS